MFENYYDYKVKQTLFNKGKEEIVDISCTVIIRCEAGKSFRVLIIILSLPNQYSDVVAIIVYKYHQNIAIISMHGVHGVSV